MTLNIDYNTDQEILNEDQDILKEELNESREEFQTDDLFSDDKPDDLFAENTKESLDVKSVSIFLDALCEMVGGVISAITGKETQRYVPPAPQRKNLANSFVKAFPIMTFSPKIAFIIALVIAYTPITITIISDVKEKNNAKSSADNSSRN